VFLISFLAFTSYASEKIELPQPGKKGGMPIEKAMFERRSVRSFTGKVLSLKEVSQILWAAGGATVDGITGPTRAYPSAGAAYPLEIYIVAGKVEELPPRYI